jgi:hypothetical protein
VPQFEVTLRQVVKGHAEWEEFLTVRVEAETEEAAKREALRREAAEEYIDEEWDADILDGFSDEVVEPAEVRSVRGPEWCQRLDKLKKVVEEKE